MAQAPRGAKRSAGAMLFVSRLLVGAAGNCGVRRALKHAFAPFGGSRLKLGMTDQRRLVGYAWVDVRDAEAAQEAINALDGRLRLLCDALTVRPPDGAQLFDVAPAGAELAARDAAHDSEAYDSSGNVGVNFVTDKRDLFFPSLSYNLKRRLRFDDVAWYSVMDELHAGRLGNVFAAVAAAGARKGLSKECAVLDVFGCVGGTAIALARGDFASVEACELDAGRADMLRHNADVVLGAEGSLRAKLSVFHGDGIARARGTNAPIVFLDPPWATSIGLESTIPTFDGLRFEDFIFELCVVRGTAIVAARLPKK
ncbi:hypothetical protein M885DRAFT_117726 [Pelagophyceae sp. CCMP2097]|nr:hypothetical protein M885DRAFT_117726 [Pelagophyceae sp. CCMP2097]